MLLCNVRFKEHHYSPARATPVFIKFRPWMEMSGYLHPGRFTSGENLSEPARYRGGSVSYQVWTWWGTENLGLPIEIELHAISRVSSEVNKRKDQRCRATNSFGKYADPSFHSCSSYKRLLNLQGTSVENEDINKICYISQLLVSVGILSDLHNKEKCEPNFSLYLKLLCSFYMYCNLILKEEEIWLFTLRLGIVGSKSGSSGFKGLLFLLTSFVPI
jgi:hypothetical protein